MLISGMKRDALGQLKGNWIAAFVALSFVSFLFAVGLASVILIPLLGIVIWGGIVILANMYNKKEPKIEDTLDGFRLKNILGAFFTSYVYVLFIVVLVIPVIVAFVVIYFPTLGITAIIGNRFIALLGVGFIFLLCVAASLVCLFIIYKFGFAMYVKQENPSISATESVKLAGRIMDKDMLIKRFILDLSFIGWYLLMMVTGGVAGLFVIPYYLQTCYNFYKGAKDRYDSKNAPVEAPAPKAQKQVEAVANA
jgi:uncharacterized membrane protein